MILEILFWIFAVIALSAAGVVVTVKNSVYAVLGLIVTFLATAVTWLLLQAEFLAITLVLVYVGAVMVLFLFVVMMLDVDYQALAKRYSRWLAVAIVSSGIFVAVMYSLVRAVQTLRGVELAANTGENVQRLGVLVFSNYLFEFEIAGVILLAAIIAAIGLIYRGPRARKTQNIAEQVKVDPAQRVRLVDGI